MSRLIVTDIEGVLLLPSDSHIDKRGTFTKIYPQKILSEQLNSVAISFNPLIGTIRVGSVVLGPIFVITTVPDPLKSVTF